MPRPTTKSALMDENRDKYAALEAWLAGLTPEQMVQPGLLGDWSVKDVLAHLHEWHAMLLRWYAAGLRGENPPTPAEGYTWAQLPVLNKRIYETYRDRSLEEVITKFRTSHQELQVLIDSLSEEDLFTPGLYGWMRQNKLSAYFKSCGSSHYHWALTEMRKGLKRLASS